MNVYERNINASIDITAEDYLVTRASLLDLDHNIRLQMMVKISTREIITATGEMVKTPFGECKTALPNVDKLIGLKIERGFAKKMREAVGGAGGCTHIVELALTMASLSSNSILLEAARDPEKRQKFSEKSEEERKEEIGSFLKNSCIVFKEK
ncbi:MAG: DUF2889 domain-containing protein [Candidatus Schekmanbacteria bacterium]|nr:DUF2889 domain-containing protein [Candidatus Schekmanbacteria bacterium]